MRFRRALIVGVVALAACGGKKKQDGDLAGVGGDKGGEAAGARGGAPAALCTVDAAVDPAGTTTAADWIARADQPDAVVLDADELANLTLAQGGAAGGAAALTRRAWLTAALGALGQPARADTIDGLRAGLGLPAGGSFTVDLTSVKSVDERLVLVDAATQAGVVVLEAGDHEMIWLGRDAGGAPRVLHAVEDYPAMCDGAETTVEVGKVVVSGLDLGAGTKAGALGDRLTRLTLYARTAGPSLAGVAVERRAAPVTAPTGKACDDTKEAAIFFSPARPNRQQPLRVIATLSDDPGPVELVLIDPAGTRHTPDVLRLVGPPYTYVIQLEAPATGTWKAVLGDGSRVEACATTKVAERRRPRKGSEATVWPGNKRRTEATDNLFAAFVQRLFDYPVDQDLTWPDLHTLLRDKERNLLYDHLGHREEEKLNLDPDCADLPYTLHAYFAWKLDLPYSFVVCNRGSGKSPPRCKSTDPDRPPGDNLMSRADFKKKDEVGAFSIFARKVFKGVSSSAGRTAPKDDLTDWYPVPLTREALRPGTLYADPYGHIMMMVGWYPQTPGGYGILMGADAQPDATIGRRRFWRGNYLFTAETTRAGSGFKAYRPRFLEDGAVVAWDNAKLARSGWWVPWSTDQYDGTTDEFYDRMEELINPRPLDPSEQLVSLVDALEEAVVRRINSVDNGEKYMATATRPIDMPEGAAIFVTSGPWEDYSTPARDHRILVAVDTVLGLAEAVKRRPERYRTAAADVPAVVERLGAELETLLASRKFSYVRSDGSAQELTLADVVDRQQEFEMSYNPNDCVEIRWGAREGTPEMATCKRHAPEEQRQRMEKYRTWFATRSRPTE